MAQWRFGAIERFGLNANNHHPNRTAFGNARDQPPDRALLLSCGTNCSSRAALRRRQMANAHHSKEKVSGVQQAGRRRREVATVDNRKMISSVATFVRSATGFICMGTVMVCGLWSAEIHSKILEKVNARLPEAERFKSAWWGPSKKDRLNREYRRLFPDGNDLKQLHRLTVIMFSALALLFISVLMTQIL